MKVYFAIISFLDIIVENLNAHIMTRPPQKKSAMVIPAATSNRVPTSAQKYNIYIRFFGGEI